MKACYSCNFYDQGWCGLHNQSQSPGGQCSKWMGRSMGKTTKVLRDSLSCEKCKWLENEICTNEKSVFFRESMTSGSYCRLYQKKKMVATTNNHPSNEVDKNRLELFAKVRDANKQLTLENIDLKRELSSSKEEIKRLKEEIKQETLLKNQLYQEIETLKEIFQRKIDEVEKKNEKNINVSRVLIERGIKALLHVTNIDNLESILEEGLTPREYLKGEIKKLDQSRYDMMTCCSSLSVGRINFSYFESKKDELEAGTRFVCIHIDPLVLLDANEKYYCCHNAATSSIRRQTVLGELTNWYDFENIFADEISYMRSRDNEPRFVRRPYDLQADWPTSEQAEILYKGVITTNQFLSISFPTQFELEKSKALLHKFKIKGFVEPFLEKISTNNNGEQTSFLFK